MKTVFWWAVPAVLLVLLGSVLVHPGPGFDGRAVLALVLAVAVVLRAGRRAEA
ncbi:hypothetical protein GALAXY_47 [Arthrobacter phage Galaxy]|uniref:Uncharacterized protein n=1 Tax=Arthrobacter phage Galaxy TaxID=1772326 RepID=A0A0U4JQT5_9CAUD|nr:hypothetical protein FDG93_gp47 [Arthrobacter phage Galaxy]ALY08891.1 hypothetical protein GALAXY_47 [Arthrobacter phage Galaxy]